MSGQQKNFLFEDKVITNSEYVPAKQELKSKDNVITYTKTSAIEKRITFNIHREIQKRTFSVDRQAIELEAESIVDKKLIELGLVEENGKCLITADKRNIAVAEEARKLIKSRIDNKFEFTKKELLSLSDTTPNNAFHLDKVLNGLIGKDTHKITETYVTDDFSEIRQRKLKIKVFPVTGEDVSLTNLNSDEKILIKIEEEFIPYLIAPNKVSKNLSQGFNMLDGEIFESFDSDYSQTMYRIIEDIKNVWQNKVFTFKKLQSLFGTKYGIVKKIDNKTGKPLKNKDNDFIYELDKSENFIYSDNYLDTWRFFKRDVLNKALIEINSDKTPFIVKIVEIRENRKKPLEGIKFQVDRKKDNNFNNFIRYSNIPYYVAILKQFEKANSKDELIKNLDEWSKSKELINSLEEYKLNQMPFTTPIGIAHNYNELELRVQRNILAVKEIKSILARNIPKISQFKFNEDYLVLIDSSTTRSGRLMLNKRLGDDAIECLDYLNEKFGAIIEEDVNTKEKDLTKFLNFKFNDKISGEIININKNNLDKYKSQIEAAIELGNKKDFKGFKAMTVKKEFYKIYFGDK